MKKSIDRKIMISERKGKYPFLIANIDSSSKGKTHWWNIFHFEPKTDIFFFDLFGLDGLKTFIIQDDKKVIEKSYLGVNR